MKKQNQKNLLNNSKSLQDEILFLKREVEIFKERNVEKDEHKAWETSNARKILIALFTYFVMVLIMGSIGVENPFINAIVPTLGFLLSTLSLSLFRKYF